MEIIWLHHLYIIATLHHCPPQLKWCDCISLYPPWCCHPVFACLSSAAWCVLKWCDQFTLSSALKMMWLHMAMSPRYCWTSWMTSSWLWLFVACTRLMTPCLSLCDSCCTSTSLAWTRVERTAVPSRLMLTLFSDPWPCGCCRITRQPWILSWK